MIVHEPRKRPESWSKLVSNTRHRWTIPLVAFDWLFEWLAYFLSNWRFLEVLEYLGSFSVLVAVIFYFSESGNRIKQKHYQAWQVINTAQGKGGNGGRIEALQELNEDRVPLTGVDVSGAFLQGLSLRHGALARADLGGCDLRDSNLSWSDLTFSNLRSANLRNSNLAHVHLVNANLADVDLNSARLGEADLAGAVLDNADLRHADIAGIHWQNIHSIDKTNIAQARNAPEGFVKWALAHGAVQQPEQ